MRRIFILLFSLVLLLSQSQQLFAQTETDNVTFDGIVYEVYLDGEDKGKASVVGPADKSTFEGEVTIRSSVYTGVGRDRKFFVVNSIKPRAFEKCTNITKVTIPYEVEYVGSGAFNECNGIQKVIFEGPKDLSLDKTIHLNHGAFQLCTSMTSLEIKRSVYLSGEYVFNACTTLSTIVGSENITELAAKSFSSCRSLTGFTFNENIKVIPDKCFNDCFAGGTIEINIPESVETIGEYAFNFAKIHKLNIGSNVKTLGRYAFRYSDVQDVRFPKGNNLTSIGEGCFINCENLESFLHRPLPCMTLREIPDNCFSGCVKLRFIDIDMSIDKIGLHAFYNTGLTELKINHPYHYYLVNTTLPRVKDKLTIGTAAFAECKDLKTVEFDGEITLSDSIFQNSDKLQSINYKSGETLYSIGNYAFDGCKSFTTFSGKVAGSTIKEGYNIPSYVREIGKYAFTGTALTSVRIPEGVTEISDYAFSACTDLTKVEFAGEKLQTIGDASFQANNLTEVIIPDNVSRIASDAFAKCFELRKVILPRLLTSIEGSTFLDCRELNYIEIPAKVTSIDESAFTNASTLASSLDVYSFSKDPAPIAKNGTTYAFLQNATLHIPTGSLEAYADKNWPISNCERDAVEKLPKPVVTETNGVISFTSEVPEAKLYVQSITKGTMGMTGQAIGNNISFDGTLHLTVYAKAEGYRDSDTVTINVNASTGKVGDLNHDGTVSVADVTTLNQQILEVGK